MWVNNYGDEFEDEDEARQDYHHNATWYDYVDYFNRNSQELAQFLEDLFNNRRKSKWEWLDEIGEKLFHEKYHKKEINTKNT